MTSRVKSKQWERDEGVEEAGGMKVCGQRKRGRSNDSDSRIIRFVPVGRLGYSRLGGGSCEALSDGLHLAD